MRELTAITDKHDAQVFVDYLLTQNISAVIRMDEGHPVVWVHNEDHLEPARVIWNAFQQNPHDSKYRSAQKPAQELRKLKEKVDAKYARLYKDSYEFWGRPSPKQVPLTLVLIVLSVAISIWIEFGANTKNLLALTMVDRPSMVSRGKQGVDFEAQWNARIQQTTAIRKGEVWRLITPIFLHFTTWHLLFNMYALFSLGGIIECRRSGWWYISFILVTGIFSNLMEFMFPTLFELQLRNDPAIGSSLFGGMSGVDFALFGYLLAKTFYAPEPGMIIPRDIMLGMPISLVVCMTGALGPVANTAHIAGLILGFCIGAFAKFWKRYVRKR